jgi:RNA polymerase sigma-70 factor (ECF subfamily)
MQKNAEATEQGGGRAHLFPERATATLNGGALRMDCESLAGRLRRGERAAAEELVDGYYDRIYLFMRAVGHDRQTSEDLTQETFMQAWHHVGQLRNGKALSSWLFRIAANMSRLYWRKHKGVSLVGFDPAPMPAEDPDGLEGASGHEELTRVHDAVARLPRKLRQAVVLHYVEQLSISEAAAVAGIRRGTLKSRLNRALEVLRKQVGEP